MIDYISYDVMVKWQGEASHEMLPATVCYTGAEDTVAQRCLALSDAIEANTIDFPDEVEDRLPVSAEIKLCP